MKKLFVIATAALLAGSAFAANPKGGPRIGSGQRPGMMREGPTDPVVRLIQNPAVAREIGLSDEQLKKIEEIRKTSRAPELQKSLRESNRRQAELLAAEKIDEAAVMAEIDKAFDIRKELAKRQTKRVIAIKSILTPEQVKKALEIAQSRAKTRRGPSKRGAPGAEQGAEAGDPPPPPPEDPVSAQGRE